MVGCKPQPLFKNPYWVLSGVSVWTELHSDTNVSLALLCAMVISTYAGSQIEYGILSRPGKTYSLVGSLLSEGFLTYSCVLEVYQGTISHISNCISCCCASICMNLSRSYATSLCRSWLAASIQTECASHHCNACNSRIQWCSISHSTFHQEREREKTSNMYTCTRILSEHTRTLRGSWTGIQLESGSFAAFAAQVKICPKWYV